MLRIECLTIDCHDPAMLAAFWRDVLAWAIADADEESVFLTPPTGSSATPILFYRVPDTKTVKNRLHLDLAPADRDAEVARIEALGARRVDVGQTGEETWVVLADPEGNEFCVLSSR